MKASSRYLVPLGVTVLLLACASSAPIVDTLRLDPTPRPQSRAATVELLAAEPARPYIAIALVTVSSDAFGEDRLRSSLIQAAARLGADAVILDPHSLARDGRQLVLSGKVVAYRDSTAQARASQ